jgi:serine/threonine-protein phosphatase 2A regulatory subunit A
LPLLEKLAKQDETVVREQSIRSLTTISKDLSDSEMQNVFCPLVIRMAQAEFFTGRVSSAGLFFHAYPRANAQKERLRKKFMELCQEDTPMIRRACAARLGEFSTQLDKQHVIQELLPIFRQLSQDDQDAIRVLCIEALIPMAGHLSKEENRVHTLGSLLNAGEDKSWKVRLCFARNFAKFADAFGKDITDNNLIQTFNLLLNDSEPEVKNAAINSLGKSLTNLSTEKICNILLPTLQSTYADAQVPFKAGVALALCEMAPIVGKDYTLSRIVPILSELMKDDSSEVRFNVSSNLRKLAGVTGTDLLSPSILSIFTGLTKDPQWRVRMACFELLGDLALALD